MTQEAERLKSETPIYDDDKEIMQLEDGKITSFVIEVKEDWKKYVGDDGGTRKIVTVIHDHKEKIWFLNTRNPLYKEIVLKLKEGTRSFKIMRTGKRKDTRYTLVNE